MRRPPRNRTTPGRRRGFTMVELLVVILIIAILMALLLPAVFAAVRAANDARVSAEEQNIQTALADFKNKYGEYPPSRIILWNLTAGTTTGASTYGSSGTAVATGDIDVGDLNKRTVRAMRKYWPRAAAYFPTSGTAGVSIIWSSSASAGTNGYVILQGHECLVFFLGGMPQAVGTSVGGWGMTGFNRDPANPFSTSVTANRNPPLFEFAPQRLVDTDGDGFPSYIDPLSQPTPVSQARPYAYFSAYGNNGYDPNDDNSGAAEQDDSGAALSRPFYVSFAISAGTRVATSAPPNPYTVGDADPSGSVTNIQWANPQTFQIVSAGRDGLWGLGGPYDGSSTGNRLPVGFPNDPSNAVAVRKRERDNIANFAGGRLD